MDMNLLIMLGLVAVVIVVAGSSWKRKRAREAEKASGDDPRTGSR
jgi:hypothetical protein